MPDAPKIRTNIKTDIKTRVRVRVMYDVICELSKDFGFPPDMNNVLYKGIVEQQILGEIKGYYLNSDEKLVGMVTFQIDWESHMLYASTQSGNAIAISSDKSLLEQFADWAVDIVRYMKTMIKEMDVKKVRVCYVYREEIRRDPAKNQEADKFLSLTTAKDIEEHDIDETERFERHLDVVSQMLPELKISIDNHVK